MGLTHHYHLLVVSEDGVAVDHADNGHAQVTSNTKGDAEANAREDGNDVTPRQAETCTVHHGHLFLLHHLWPSFRWKLDGLAIFLLLLKSSVCWQYKPNLLILNCIPVMLLWLQLL